MNTRTIDRRIYWMALNNRCTINSLSKVTRNELLVFNEGMGSDGMIDIGKHHPGPVHHWQTVRA
jgi:hypothetical protein